MGDVGPKFETHVPDLGAREYFNLLILDQLSRKSDESWGAPICNTVLQHFSCNMVDAIRTTPQETLF